MLGSYTRITDSTAVLAATDHHPLARLTARSAGADVVGYVGATSIVWTGGGPDHPQVAAIGDGPAAIEVVATLYRDGAIVAGTRAQLPRMDHDAVRPAFPDAHVIDWDLRWLTSLPPVRLGERRVVVLDADDHDAIDTILDAALPDSHIRPGSPRVRAWYGIRDGTDLVAVAADTSSPGVGFINSIAVRPDRHGRGFGGALTAYVARRQFAASDLVLLGVMADNVEASRLYHRLGYTGVHEMTTFTVRDYVYHLVHE